MFHKFKKYCVMATFALPVIPNLSQTLTETKENTLLSSLQYKRLSDWINVQPIKKQDKKALVLCEICANLGGGGKCINFVLGGG